MKNGWAALALGSLIGMWGCASGGGAGSPSASAGSTSDSAAKAAPPSAGSSVNAGTITLPSGLKYEDIKVGEGPVADNGMSVTVNYTGWLTDGTKFDSSLDQGKPFTFSLGGGNVIRGWDEGVKGMRVGGKRKLTIPPDLGYGAAGAGSTIPPNSTLVFEVELLKVQ